MDRIAKGKWQVRLAALAVFVLGFAAGALALNAYRAGRRALFAAKPTATASR